MIQLENTIISDEVFSEEFICNLSKCKGICCVEGDSGAPLEQNELQILDNIFDDIKPFLRQEGIEAILAQGKFIVDEDGDFVTPLINGNECAYVIFDQNNIAKCGIEEAYNAKVIDFQKPISCHLYPIRLQEYKTFTAVNYHHWEICNEACALGKSLKVKVLDFLEIPLKRKFGKVWFEKLKEIQRKLREDL